MVKPPSEGGCPVCESGEGVAVSGRMLPVGGAVQTSVPSILSLASPSVPLRGCSGCSWFIRFALIVVPPPLGAGVRWPLSAGAVETAVVVLCMRVAIAPPFSSWMDPEASQVACLEQMEDTLQGQPLGQQRPLACGGASRVLPAPLPQDLQLLRGLTSWGGRRPCHTPSSPRPVTSVSPGPGSSSAP